MALFDKILPPAVTNFLSSSTSKVAEATTHAFNTLGGAGNLSKVTANSASLDELASLSQAELQALAGKYGGGVNVDTLGRASQELINNDPLTNNPLSLSVLGSRLQKQDGAVGASQATGSSVDVTDDSHMIKLSQLDGPVVLFRNMPEVTEGRSATYEAVAPPQHPGAFQKYTGTSSTQWTVNAVLTARTTAEATENLMIVNVLRAWLMPYFGANTAQQYPNKVGAPPPVLEFSGFRQQMIGPVPVVLTSLNWTFPKDVDYIPANGFRLDGINVVATGVMVPFPTVMTIQMQLIESFSTDQFNGFSLNDFRLGQMSSAFKPVKTGTRLQGIDKLGQGTVAGNSETVPQEAQRVSKNAGIGARGTTAATVNQDVTATTDSRSAFRGVGDSGVVTTKPKIDALRTAPKVTSSGNTGGATGDF